VQGPHHRYQHALSPDADYGNRHGFNNLSLSASSSNIIPHLWHHVSPSAVQELVSVRWPIGILWCSSCRVTSSLEWRKGPSGQRELCNVCIIIPHSLCHELPRGSHVLWLSCSLHYARSRAKKVGHAATTQCRKKEKMTLIAAREEVCPSQSSLFAIAGSGTRGSMFESTSFTSTLSVSSASGSDVCSQHSPIVPEPEPSLPSSSLKFISYSCPPRAPPPCGLQNKVQMQFHSSTS